MLAHSISKRSKNVQNSCIHCTQFFKECINSIYLTYTKFQIIFKILCYQWTQIFEDGIQFYIFNVHNLSKNVDNSVYSIYTIDQRTNTILYI